MELVGTEMQATQITMATGYSYSSSILEAEQFIAGMIYGLVESDDLAEIETCLNNASEIKDDVDIVIADMSSGDKAKIFAGIQELGKIVLALPNDLKDCKSMDEDIKRITAWGAIFDDATVFFTTLMGNVFKNSTKIIADITKCTDDMGKGNYYNAGVDISDMMVLCLGPVPEITKVEQAI